VSLQRMDMIAFSFSARSSMAVALRNNSILLTMRGRKEAV
jgi:hypothetical protein